MVTTSGPTNECPESVQEIYECPGSVQEFIKTSRVKKQVYIP